MSLAHFIAALQLADPVLLPDFLPPIPSLDSHQQSLQDPSSGPAANEAATEEAGKKPSLVRHGSKQSGFPLVAGTAGQHDMPFSSSTDTSTTATTNDNSTHSVAISPERNRPDVAAGSPLQEAQEEDRKASPGGGTGSSNPQHSNMHSRLASLAVVADLAVHCTSRDAKKRPTMTDIVAALTPLVQRDAWQRQPEVREQGVINGLQGVLNGLQGVTNGLQGVMSGLQGEMSGLQGGLRHGSEECISGDVL